jgi:hypothetical protein
MRGLRIVVAIAAVIFVLAGTLSAIIAIFALADTAWVGAAILGGFAGALYVLAYWLYLAWRKMAQTADREHPRASAK